MTAEQRVLIEAQDVIGFEFECPHCNGRFFVPIGNFDMIRTACPNCREQWFKVQGGADHLLVNDVLDGFKRLVKIDAPLGVKIKFQISEGALNGCERKTGSTEKGSN